MESKYKLRKQKENDKKEDANYIPTEWHKMNSDDNPKYRTQMCTRWYKSGRCMFGSKCAFAHNIIKGAPLPHLNTNKSTKEPVNYKKKARSGRQIKENKKLSQQNNTYKTKLCVGWLNGSCKNGKNCCFVHNQIELQSTSIDENIESTSIDENIESTSPPISPISPPISPISPISRSVFPIVLSSPIINYSLDSDILKFINLTIKNADSLYSTDIETVIYGNN